MRTALRFRAAGRTAKLASQARWSPDLTAEQRAAVRRAVEGGESILLLGAAGTGKSFAIRELQNGLREAGKRVQTCAPFGVAACNVNGFTVHSTFGLNPHDLESLRFMQHGSREYRDKLGAITRASARSRRKLWKQADAIIIDEISTLEAELLDLIDHIARKVRGTDTPFGGIQLISVGDFLQLPPVKGTWAFESEAFQTVYPEDRCIRLGQVLRQTEAGYLSALTTLRTVEEGDPIQIALARHLISENCVVMDSPSSSKKAQKAAATASVRLVPTRRQARAENERRLAELVDVPAATFTSVNGDVCVDEKFCDVQASEVGAKTSDVLKNLAEMLDNGRLQPFVELRVGARVMMLHNTSIYQASSSDIVVNGHTGTVVGFKPFAASNDDELRWAEQNKGSDGQTVVPLVKWDHHRRTSPVKPISQQVGGNIMTSGWSQKRTQIPLNLAYAVTTHKCQGMTLRGAVTVDLNHGWEYGQAYVALSRAKTGSKTLIYGLHAVDTPLTANPSALAFCRAHGIA
eukprot:TRINITY_DN46737_c0_g1_i1.p1 TRINITY_DN46737_c0_g1~~TRINITY_DN46737_c0_g1_i1.p1  ORF type:complete len:519 (+),score=81.93 TRINITY_DN46737_c0_g1_i1:89-1645(+)